MKKSFNFREEREREKLIIDPIRFKLFLFIFSILQVQSKEKKEINRVWETDFSLYMVGETGFNRRFYLNYELNPDF